MGKSTVELTPAEYKQRIRKCMIRGLLLLGIVIAVVAGSLLLIGLSATPLREKTSEAAPKVVALHAYNEEQERRGKAAEATWRHQAKDECVYYQVMAAQRAFGLEPIDEDTYRSVMGGKVKDVFDFSRGFWGARVAGESVGGVFNYARNRTAYSADEMLAKVIAAVDDGRVAVMALNAHPLYVAWLKANGGEKQWWMPYRPHAVRIAGLHRDTNHRVDGAWVMDTNTGQQGGGPGPVYYVPWSAVEDAFFWASPIARGIFVSDKRMHTPLAVGT